jgi:hypothetical protein
VLKKYMEYEGINDEESHIKYTYKGPLADLYSPVP